MNKNNISIPTCICPSCGYIIPNDEKELNGAKQNGFKVGIEFGKTMYSPSVFWITCPVCKKITNGDDWFKNR
jgi:C4-type Zn-finger protein